MSGVLKRKIQDSPIAVIDFETTGVTAGRDRVVEVSVVRLDPGEPPRLVFDSLVNPRRRVSGTQIHRITDDHVAFAPDFREIAGDIADAISDCVLAAYNVYFDIRFFEREFTLAGVKKIPPHFCLMYLRPFLDLGCKCKLSQACKEHGISIKHEHIASADAMASASLLQLYLVQLYLAEMGKNGISTYEDWRKMCGYAFVESFLLDPIPSAAGIGLIACGTHCSRAKDIEAVEESSRQYASYMDTIKAVVADFVIDDDELELVKTEQGRLNLSKEQIKAVHAQVFSAVMAEYTDDDFLDDNESSNLQRLWRCFDILGWAPGQ